MGELIRLKCEKCGKSYDLGIGQGMTDNNLETVLAHFDPQTADRIRKELSTQKPGDRWSYRKMIGYCDSCRSYSEIPTFHITKNDKNLTVAGKCSCGSICTLIDDSDRAKMSDIRCPLCNGIMTAVSNGMWD